MSLMATVLTRADLDALPADGLRHELIDGTFIMSPAPGPPHQRVAFALARALHTAVASTGLDVLMAPLDVVLGPHVVEPDIVVAPRDAFTARDLPVAPVLVVEVRSPTTGWLDDGRKRSMYEEFGVASYWLVDPAAPSITVLELDGDRYVEVATARGDQAIRVQRPVEMELTPARLTAG